MTVHEKATIGKYSLLKRLASGGMGEVFLARQEGEGGFEKLVAIKRILPHLTKNETFVRMFLDEARTSALLNHVNIVQIYELSKDEGSYFIAMEYIHGQNLREIIDQEKHRRQTIPIPFALLMIRDACNGLYYAHRKTNSQGKPLHIVHRDISPQNILVSYEGEVKIADFGIARAADRLSDTSAGMLKGKIAYMSPEQVAGNPLTPASDIFSLGIVFYEAVTGERPFDSNSSLKILQAIQEARVTPPSELNPEIPSALDTIILKTMARDPVDRYPDARELSKDLQKILSDLGEVLESSFDLPHYLQELFAEQIAKEAEIKPLESTLVSDVSHERMEVSSHADLYSGAPHALEGNPQEVTETMEGENSPLPKTLIAGMPEPLSASSKTPVFLDPLLPSKLKSPSQGKLQPVLEPIGPKKRFRFWMIFVLFVLVGCIFYTPIHVWLQNQIPYFHAKTQDKETSDPALPTGPSAISNPQDKIPNEPKSPPEPVLLVMKITSHPPNAKITLNGRLRTEVTPTELRLPKGKTVDILLEKEGYDPWQQTQTVEPGPNLSVEGKLTPIVTTLSVTSIPPGATISLDGIRLSLTPKTLPDVSFGNHQILVALNGYESEQETFYVKNKTPISFKFALKPQKRPLVVQSNPSGAQIWLNGEHKGQTPFTLESVSADPLDILLKKEGYEDTPWQGKRPIDKSELMIDLKPLTLLNFAVTSQPPGLDVFIDSKNRGQTPFVLKDQEGLSVGKHQIAFFFRGQKLESFDHEITPERKNKFSQNFYGAIEIITDEADIFVEVDGQNSCQAPCTFEQVFIGPHKLTFKKQNLQVEKEQTIEDVYVEYNKTVQFKTPFFQ